MKTKPASSLYLHGPIGMDITSASVVSTLAGFGGDELHVRINSPGGDAPPQPLALRPLGLLALCRLLLRRPPPPPARRSVCLLAYRRLAGAGAMRLRHRT